MFVLHCGSFENARRGSQRSCKLSVCVMVDKPEQHHTRSDSEALYLQDEEKGLNHKRDCSCNHLTAVHSLDTECLQINYRAN